MEKLSFTPEECYNKIKIYLEKKSIRISDKKEINHGIQFRLVNSNHSSNIRIFHSKKKGTNIDFSTLQPELFKNQIISLLEDCFNTPELPFISKNTNDTKSDTNISIIGTDESGKGDYFGPLVVAAVFVEDNQYNELIKLGVQDSKRLTDIRCKDLASKIKAYPHSVVVIGPEKYNGLYSKIQNLNKLLAWGHARVIENLLEKVNCNNVLSDQFGSERFILNALMKRGKEIHLEQKPRAEENIAVASASILARVGFLNYMDRLSKEYNITFVKGASQKVVELGKKLIKLHGNDVLNKVAKLHFKTTKEII
ncbi:MAG: ribonuclease HIII [Spirochaetota bacterium]|nr:ribonuclease HIII [Spirochaetota bacterium]